MVVNDLQQGCGRNWVGLDYLSQEVHLPCLVSVPIVSANAEWKSHLLGIRERPIAMCHKRQQCKERRLEKQGDQAACPGGLLTGTGKPEQGLSRRERPRMAGAGGRGRTHEAWEGARLGRRCG